MSGYGHGRNGGGGSGTHGHGGSGTRGHGGSGTHGHGGSGSYGGGYNDNRGGAHSSYEDRRHRHGYDSKSRDRDRRGGRDDRGREERGQPPQGPSHSQARQSSSAEEEPHDRVFAQFCDEKNTCVCIFSAIGLTWLKERPGEAKIIEEAIGGTLPERVPDGCKGSLKGGETALLDHAAAKKGRARVRGKGDSSDSEDEDQAMLQKGHAKFHAYLERRIPPTARLKQAHRMLQGQNKEHNAKVQRVQETNQQRVEAGVQERRELVRRHEQERQESERKNEKSLQALQHEFGEHIYDEALQAQKQAHKLERLEAETRQNKMELDLMRRGLEEKDMQRKEELEAKLMEVQETNREVEQEKDQEAEKRLQQKKQELQQLKVRQEEKDEEAKRRLQKKKKDLAELQEELDETNKCNGVLVGDGMEFNDAKVWVYNEIRRELPPGGGPPWRAFGDVDVGELASLGLKDQDHMAATGWGQGIWLTKPNLDGLEDEPDGWPPFIADWAFIKKRVTDERTKVVASKQVVETVVEYVTREDDEVITTPRLMPKDWRGPQSTLTETKSAAFVKHLRRKYPRREADAILKYLLEKYKEYELHSGGLGFHAEAVIRKLWKEDANREMTLEEMCKLLMGLHTTRSR